MAQTRATLLAQVNGYMHRTDLPVDFLTTASDGNGFIDYANAKIGEDFRCLANAITAPLASPYLLPADFRQLIRVQAAGPTGLYPLMALSGESESLISQSSGALPAGYWLQKNQLNLAPSYSGSLTVEYFSAITLAATPTSSTNALLTAFPNAYLWHCLGQAFAYVQNLPLSEGFFNAYEKIKNEANAAYRLSTRPSAFTLPNTQVGYVAT